MNEKMMLLVAILPGCMTPPPGHCAPLAHERMPHAAAWLASQGYDVDIRKYDVYYGTQDEPICDGKAVSGCTHLLADTIEIRWPDGQGPGPAALGEPVLVHELLHVWLWQTQADVPQGLRADPEHERDDLFGHRGTGSVVDQAYEHWSHCRYYDYPAAD